MGKTKLAQQINNSKTQNPKKKNPWRNKTTG
jgi:hypothetical protein